MGARAISKMLMALVLVVGMFPTAASAAEMQAGVQAGATPDAQAGGQVLEGQATLDILQAGLPLANGSAPDAFSVQASALTSTQAAKIRERVLYAYENLQTEVKVDDLRIPYSESARNAISDVVSDAVNSHPELFFADSSYRYSFYEGGNFSSLFLSYSYDTSAIDGMKKVYESAMEDLIAWVPDNAEQVQQAKAVHDWIVRHCDYNDDAAKAGGPARFGKNDPWNAYGALVENKPVCEGYTLAFIDAMNRLAIPCTFVSNYVGGEGHAWNRACVGGSWFNLDVTWDDNYTINEVPDTTFFMKSDKWFKTHEDDEGFHKTWTPAGVAGTDTRYDAYTNSDWPAYSGKADSSYGVVSAFELSATKLALQTGGTATISIRGIEPAELSSSVTRAKAKWTSSRPAVAAVDGKGVVIAGSTPGTTTITCAIGTLKRMCTVTVSKPLSAPLAKGAVVAKSGATYKVTNSGKLIVTLLKAPNTKKVTVAKTVSLMGRTYTVSGISKNAFSKSKATTVKVKSTTLTKKSVKGCFKGAKVKTVTVPSAKKAAYKKIFAKSNSGLKVKVK